MSHRIRLTIPDATGDDLAQLARHVGQSANHLAADLLRSAIELALRPNTRAKPPPIPPAQPDAGAPWLEPRNDRRLRWRTELWTAVLAVHERYSDELANLEADWWRNPSRVEVLGALATCRSTIDTSGRDPREELAFHTQLIAFGQMLDLTPGISGAAFTDATPPAELMLAVVMPQLLGHLVAVHDRVAQRA